jgi:hypothetical protein
LGRGPSIKGYYLRHRQDCEQKIRHLPQDFGLTAVDEHGAAASSITAINVAPSVPPQAVGHINVQLGCSLEQHPLMGFATVTGRSPLTGVEADLDPVDWQPGPNVEMDLIHNDAIKSATSDVGLVGGNNQDEARRFEPRAGPGNRGHKFKLPKAHGRIRLAPPLQGAVDDAIAIQKNGRPQSGRILGHGMKNVNEQGETGMKNRVPKGWCKTGGSGQGSDKPSISTCKRTSGLRAGSIEDHEQFCGFPPEFMALVTSWIPIWSGSA